MTPPRVMLATLVLNELPWLQALYDQHRNWPGLVQWCFVEGTDKVFWNVNPELTTPEGLSKDGTTEFLAHLAANDPRVSHIKLGMFGGGSGCDPAQGKCEARQKYLDKAEPVEPNFLVILDADEFYSYDAQLQVNRVMAQDREIHAFSFRQRQVWRPPCYNQPGSQVPLLAYEVLGGFWDIPHVRGWRWQPGLRYHSNHNTPELANGMRLDQLGLRRYQEPQCVHMGWTSSLTSRQAKNKYYQARGEGKVDKRGWYVESRAAWETWKPGEVLPYGAKVVPYRGPIPEVFRSGREYVL